jgi:superfamily II DNA or RNA helicase
MLRPYQTKFVGDIHAAWNQGARNVVGRLDTGGGKTKCLATITRDNVGATATIAHRQELVGQLSLALAREGVRHRIIAADKTIRGIVQDHSELIGRSFYDPSSPHAVISIDTLVRATGLESWARQVTLFTVDEGHHLVKDNKWHTGVELFTNPHVRGLLPTATPTRADGKGLGRDFDGIADVMVQGPPMRWLIEQGYLTDYRVVCPPSDMQLLEEDIGASGDWSTAKLRAAARDSHIVGDVVSNYLRFGAGKLWVTFCPDTETAAEIERAYLAAGVRAALLTGTTDPGLRRNILRRYAAREIMQLVVVDIVSEGFDLPAIEGGSMARTTASLATYMQQFGRMLRPMDGKGKALLIDHVGNFVRHGPPDRERPWTLERRDKRAKKVNDEIPLRVCTVTSEESPYYPGCFQPFERIYKECPYCGAPIPAPVARDAPAMVDGDLEELDAETLAKLRGAVTVADMSNEDYRAHLAARNVPLIGQLAQVKRHDAARAGRDALRAAVGAWGGYQKAAGLTDSQMQRKFFLTFGVDVLTAWAMSGEEADTLRGRIDDRCKG